LLPGIVTKLEAWLLRNPNPNRKLDSYSAHKSEVAGTSSLTDLTKTKSIDRGSHTESPAGRQSDGYDGWCLDFRWEERS